VLLFVPTDAAAAAICTLNVESDHSSESTAGREKQKESE